MAKAKKTASITPNEDDHPLTEQATRQKSRIQQLTDVLGKRVGKSLYLGTPKEIMDLHAPTSWVSTGIWKLDSILSRGKGIPGGRMIEISGADGAGKTSLALYLMGRYKARNADIYISDTEHTLDPKWLSDYGIADEDWIPADVGTNEAMWMFLRAIIENPPEDEKGNTRMAAYLVDSITNLPTENEMEEDDHEDSHVASAAKSNSKGTRVTTRMLSASKTTVFLLQQLRDNLNAVRFGSKTLTGGGRALKHAYSISLKAARFKSISQTINKVEKDIGHILRITTEKNKLAPPKQYCDIILSYSHGIDPWASNWMWCEEIGLITPSGKDGYKWRGDAADTNDLPPIADNDAFPEWYAANRAAVYPDILKEMQEVIPETEFSAPPEE